jgi:hypothetical protein
MRVAAILIMLAGTAYGQAVSYNVSNIINVGSTTINNTNISIITNNVEITGVTINVTNISMTTGGIVSNVTESTSNSWDAGTGNLTINTNPPVVDSGITGLTASADSAGVVAYVDDQNWTVGTNLTGVAGGGGAAVYGVNAPTVIDYSASVTLSTGTIWQAYAPTNVTTITPPTKGSAGDAGLIRLDLTHNAQTVTVEADGAEMVRYYPGETLVLWFQSPSGMTNWTVRQERGPINWPHTTRKLQVMYRPSITLDATAWWGPQHLDAHLVPSGVTVSTNGWEWPAVATGTNNIQMPLREEFDPGGDSYTLTAWVNVLTNGTMAVGNNVSSGTDDRWGMRNSAAGLWGGLVNISAAQALATDATTNLWDNNWRLWGLVINTSDGFTRAYLDGVQLTANYNANVQRGYATKASRVTGGSAPSHQKFHIGNFSSETASASNAWVDAVAIWKTALTSNEMVEVYNAGRDWR